MQQDEACGVFGMDVGDDRVCDGGAGGREVVQGGGSVRQPV